MLTAIWRRLRRKYEEWPYRLILCGDCGQNKAVRDVCQGCGGRSWVSRIPLPLVRPARPETDMRALYAWLGVK